jgi:hypothetical protein
MPFKVKYTIGHLAISGVLFAIVALGTVELTNFKRTNHWWWPFGALPVSGTTDTPLKVRGGAPTFRTDPYVSFVSAGSNYCVALGGSTSTLTLYLWQPGNHSGTPTQLPVPSGGQIDFFWRMPDGVRESDNGARVDLSHPCNGSSLGALISPETLPMGSTVYSAFYAFRNNAGDDDYSHVERFEDTSANCQRPPSPNWDEDSCEHLKSIYIHNSLTTTPRDGSGTKWDCVNGECEVEFVVFTPTP